MKKIDLFFKDKEIAKETMRIAIPTVIESLFICLTGMVDTWMISGLGSASVAAIGLTTQPKVFIFSIFFSMNIAISSRISFKRGAKEQKEAGNMFVSGFWFTLIAGIICSILSVVFAEPIIKVCGGKPETMDSAVLYFRIIMGTMLITMFSLYFNAVQRGCGRPKISMYSNIVSNVINVIFNWLLIGGHCGFPALGILGAAIATALGQFVALIMSTVCMFNKDGFINFQYIIKNRIHTAKEQSKDLYGMMKTLLAETLLMRAGFMLSHILNGHLDVGPYAATQVGMLFMNLGFAFGDGLQNATMILVGKCFGEQNIEKAKQYFKCAKTRGFNISIIVAVFMVVFARQINGLFFKEPEIIGYGVVIFRYIAVIIPVQIIRIVISGFLRGAGDVRYSLVASTIANTFVQPATLLVMILILNMGYIGTWTGILFAQIATFCFFEARIISGKWQNSKYLNTNKKQEQE